MKVHLQLVTIPVIRRSDESEDLMDLIVFQDQ